MILTFLILTILVVLVLQLAYSSKMDERLVKNHQDNTQNYYTLRSGLQLAKLVLEDDLKNSKYDSLKEIWASKEKMASLALGKSQLSMEIEDLERKINLNLLADKKWKTVIEGQLKRLCKALQLSEDIALAIVDYIDEDKEGKFEKYQHNKPIQSLDDLLVLDNVDKKVLYGDTSLYPPQKGLAPFLALMGNGKININTASKEVLMALDDKITEEKADEILQHRQEKPFEKTEDLKQIPDLDKLFSSNPPQNEGEGNSGNNNGSPPDGNQGGGSEGNSSQKDEKPPSFQDQITVQSSYFQVLIKSQTGSMAQKATAYLYRDSKNVYFLYWNQSK